MDLTGFIAHIDGVKVGVFIILFLMSLATWAVAIGKLWQLRRVRKLNRATEAAFEWIDSTAELARQIADTQGPMAVIVKHALSTARRYRGYVSDNPEQRQHLDDALVRGVRQGLDQAETRLQSGQLLFATVGALAPFIGLFGTVWGIYLALVGLEHLDNVTIDAVAGPLGAALVATAAGLAAAIPAVLFYNLYNRAIRLLNQRLEAFAHDVHALILHDPELSAYIAKARGQKSEPTLGG